MQFIPDEGEAAFDPEVQAFRDWVAEHGGLMALLYSNDEPVKTPVELSGVMSLLEMTYEMAHERFVAYLKSHGVSY